MSLAQFVQTQEPTVSLESMLEVIALESGVMANMLETFKKVVPSFLLKLKETNQFLSNNLEEQDKLRLSLSGKEKSAISRAKHLDYLTFGDRVISIPENFKGDFIKYAVQLNAVATAAYQTQSLVLLEYNQILSSFLTNKEDKISLKDHTTFFNRIKAEREGYAHKLAAFRNEKTGVTKTRFRSVISRMADVEALVNETSKLTSQHSKAKLHDIHRTVNESVDLLNMIIEGIQDGTISNISPNATMNISQGAYEVAKYVEFVGVVYFDITVFLNCVENMIDALTSN